MKKHYENSKKFELDRYLIKKIYNIKEKRKPKYQVIKKNIVYEKQPTNDYSYFSNNNKNNYYSLYKSFRDYFSSGYNSTFLENELSNIDSILSFSRNIRENISKKINPNQKLNLSKNSYLNQNLPFMESNNNFPSNNLNNNPQNQKINNFIPSKGQSRRPSAVFQIDKENPKYKKMAELAHQSLKKDQKKFIEKCHLLIRKKELEEKPQKPYNFRLFSKLSEEFDPFYLPVYENFMYVKFENQKTKLVNMYNQEKAFINCVTYIKSKLKSMNDMSNSQNKNEMSQNIKKPEIMKKIPYINSFYYGRTEFYYKDIDNFMSMYKSDTSLTSKQLEKDFFENLYKILTYNNTDCKRFLHYLYSKNFLFKYIYNIFTKEDKKDNDLKNIAPSIDRHIDVGPFLNQSQRELFLSEKKEKKSEDKLFLKKIKDIDEEKKEQEKEVNNFLESLIGNEFIYKINLNKDNVSDFVNKKIKDKFIKVLTNNKKYEDNFVLTLNNSENLLQIIDIKNNSKFFSQNFDENISFYDLESDIKHNIKSDKIKQNEKFVLLTQKKLSEFSKSYIIKLSKDIFSRFSKSILSKGFKIKNVELFSSDENSFHKSEEKEEKITSEDLLNLKGNEDKSKSGEDKILTLEEESEKPSSSNNENKIRFNDRNFNKQITFKESSIPDEKDKLKNDSSMEVQEGKESDDEESEEEESKNEEDNDDDKMDEESEDEKKEFGNENNNFESFNDNNIKNNDIKDNNNNTDDENPINKLNYVKENHEEEEKSEKDNNNKISEENEENKSEESSTDNVPNINNKTHIKKKFQEEEINTDIDKANNFYKATPGSNNKSNDNNEEEGEEEE